MVESFHNLNPDYVDFLKTLSHDEALDIWLDFNAYKISYDAGGDYGGNDVEAYVLKEHVDFYGTEPEIYAYLTEAGSWISGANSGISEYDIDDIQVLQNPNDFDWSTYMAELASNYSTTINFFFI